MMRSLSIAHAAGLLRGRKSTPFGSGLNLRVELANRKTAGSGSTLPTLPTLFSERGRKIDPPLSENGVYGLVGLNRPRHVTRFLRFNPSATPFCCINARDARGMGWFA